MTKAVTPGLRAVHLDAEADFSARSAPSRTNGTVKGDSQQKISSLRQKPQRVSSSAREQDEAVHGSDKTVFGFWIYIMTDCVLFATLFATYAVLHNNTYGGPGARELFSMPFVLAETIILLTSSYTAGLAMLYAHRGNKRGVLAWFAVTFLLGAAFLGLELHEFSNLVAEGHSWRESGFLSAFFTLVGTHGLHITSGLIWMTVLMTQVVRKGLTGATVKRLTLLSLFWHFLDIVWIFIFTIVYLLGAIS